MGTVTSQRIASICGSRAWSSRSATSFRAQTITFGAFGCEPYRKLPADA